MASTAATAIAVRCRAPAAGPIRRIPTTACRTSTPPTCTTGADTRAPWEATKAAVTMAASGAEHTFTFNDRRSNMTTRHLYEGAARRAGLAAAVAMGVALGACTTMGTGTGSTVQGDNPVSFAWTSRDGGVTGTMTATLSTGSIYTGPDLKL